MRRLLTSLVLAVMAMGATVSYGQGLNDPRDAAQIYVEATAAGDIDAIVALYAPNALFLAPNLPVISGHENIRKVFENNFSLGPNTIEFGSVNLDMSGNRAVIFWTWLSEIKRAEGEPIKTYGRSLVYFVRAEDGWYISADMFQPAG